MSTEKEMWVPIAGEKNIELLLRLRLGEIVAHLFRKKPTVRPLAYARADLNEVHLERGTDPSIWVGRAAFDIRLQDIETIATTFGLQVRGDAA